MKVHTFNQQKDLPLSKRSVAPIVKAVLTLEGCTTDEIHVHFLSLEGISALHADYFSDPTPTDCISLVIDEPHHITPHHVLGEVFVCPKVALNYAHKHNHDPYQETTLYLVHGLLHLLSYDDLTSSAAKKMRAAEKRHMAYLLDNNLLLHK